MGLSSLKKKPFFFAVCGYKNSGKTTLITKVIPYLTENGYKVAVIKHDGHSFEGDVPGTDSYRHWQAGAYATAVFSDHQLLIKKQCEKVDELQIAKAFPEADIILIEGLKQSSYPKYRCSGDYQHLIDPQKLAQKIIECKNAEENAARLV